MTDERAEGAARQVRGSVAEAIGKLSGDEAGQAEGAAQKREGERQVAGAPPPAAEPPPA